MKKRTEIVTRERSLDRREGGALGLFIEYDLVRSRPVGFFWRKERKILIVQEVFPRSCLSQQEYLAAGGRERG